MGSGLSTVTARRPHSAPRRSPSCDCDGSNSDPKKSAMDVSQLTPCGIIMVVIDSIYIAYIYIVYIYIVYIYSVYIYIWNWKFPFYN